MICYSATTRVLITLGMLMTSCGSTMAMLGVSASAAVKDEGGKMVVEVGRAVPCKMDQEAGRDA